MIGNKLEPFKFWCQKVLPNVYDDSLSYYEYLCKLNEYLNEVIEQINTLTDNMEDYEADLTATWLETKSYIDNYFNNLDVQQEINNKLDQMAESGALSTLLAPIVGTQIGGVVANQIGATVASQIGATVASQIDASVNGQISEPVATATAQWLAEHITPTEPTIDETLSIQGAGADAKSTGDIIGNQYSSSATYSIGDYVIYNGSLYTCLETISSGEAWTSSKWGKVNTSSQINNLNNQVIKTNKINITFSETGNGYINNSGAIDPSGTSFSTSDYIRVDSKLGEIIISGKLLGLIPSFTYIHAYSSESSNSHLGGYIAGGTSAPTATQSIKLATGTKYIRVSVGLGNETKFQIYQLLYNVLPIMNDVDNIKNTITNDENILSLNELKITFSESGNGFQEESGGITANSAFSTSDYIPCVNNIFIKGDLGYLVPNLHYVHAFDESFNHLGGYIVGGTSVTDLTSVSMDSKTAYIRVTVHTSAENTFKLWGNTNSLYEAVINTRNNSIVDNDSDIPLPEIIDCMSGHELDIYYDTLSKYDNKEKLYIFDNGSLSRNTQCVKFTPNDSSSDLTVPVKRIRENGSTQETKTVTIRVNKKINTTLTTKNILICGDSLIANGAIPTEVYSMLTTDNDITFNQLGTRGSTGGKHEGRGGWNWYAYANLAQYDGVPNAFWNTSTQKLDFINYCQQNSYSGIDYFLIMLGTNDMAQGRYPLSYFNFTSIFNNVKKFIDQLHSDYPLCKIAIGLPSIGGVAPHTTRNSEIWFRQCMNTMNHKYLETFDNGAYNNKITCFSVGSMTAREYAYPNSEQPLSARWNDKLVTTYSDFIHANPNGYRAWADAFYNKIRGFITDDAS